MTDLAAALPAIGFFLLGILVLLVVVIALHDRRARFFANGVLSIIGTIILAALAGLALAGLLFLIGVLIGVPEWLTRLHLLP
jgi:hypothetical protein